MNGSTEWYRGMGTQVFCRAGRRRNARAAELHHQRRTTSPRPASASIATRRRLPIRRRSGATGLELNCRLVNQDGVTLARVSPEDVCEAKFGTREWMGVAGSTASSARGRRRDARRESPTLPGQAGPGPLPRPGWRGEEPKAVSDVPLTPEALDRGCQALHGAGASAAPLTFRAIRAGDQMQRRPAGSGPIPPRNSARRSPARRTGTCARWACTAWSAAARIRRNSMRSAT